VTVPFNYSKKCPKTVIILKYSKNYSMVVKNVQNLPHNGKRFTKTTALSKMGKNYRMMVKNIQKLQHDGKK
jgi:hypothetical protein